MRVTVVVYWGCLSCFFIKGAGVVYFPVLKPIAEMSAKVIELAVAGDLTAARSCLDHVRVLRARLARTLDNDKLSVEQYLREKMVQTAGSKSWVCLEMN